MANDQEFVSHPSHDQLLLFAQGGIFDHDVNEAIEKHLTECSNCLAIVIGAPKGDFESLVSSLKQGVADDEKAVRGAPIRLIGGYEVIRELGRGGSSVVYLARQIGANRVVALKRLRTGIQATPQELARFQKEAQSLARLQHPNVVRLYDVGEQEGHPYLALEYVEGDTLQRRLEKGPLPAKAAARLLLVLARAVAYAHRSNVLHRDLKPSNVLLEHTRDHIGPDELEIGSPRITDFGLAKLLDQDIGETASGMLLGTPSYMAPEVVAKDVRNPGPSADIYALGVILYQALTGVVPFRRETVLETLECIRNQEPVEPRIIQSNIPRDLETICLKCLAKSPAHRYSSADDLADDLNRFISGSPIRARPINLVERGLKWVKRRPATAGFSALLVFALGFGAVAFQWHRIRLEGEAARASANYRDARETIVAMLGELDSARHANVPQVVELRRQLRRAAIPFFERVAANATKDAETDRLPILISLGYFEIELGMWDEATTHLNEAVRQLDRSLASQSSDIDLLKKKADCLNKLAAIDAIRLKYEEAIKGYESALQTLLQTPESSRDLDVAAAMAQTRLNLGTVREQLGDPQGATRDYGAAVELRREAIRTRPDSVRSKIAYAESLVNLARLVAPSRSEEAHRMFEEADRLLGEAAREDESSPLAKVSQAACLLNWGNLFASAGDADEAVRRFDASIAICEDVLRKEPNWQNASRILFNANGAKAQLLSSSGKDLESLEVWTKAIELASTVEERDQCRKIRMPSLVRLGRGEEVLKDSEALSSNENISPVECYNIACYLSLVLHAERSFGRDDLEREERSRQMISCAVKLLENANSKGFFADPNMRTQLESDTDLDAIRDSQPFREFALRIRDSH